MPSAPPCAFGARWSADTTGVVIALSPIVERLRAQCASLRHVAGAADFASIADRVTVHPAAWVVPLGDVAGENRFSAGATSQAVDASIGVVVCVGDVSDQKGSSAIEALTLVRREVLAALLGWPPDDGALGLNYAGGDALRFSAGLIWWQDTYSTAWEARAVAGAQA